MPAVYTALCALYLATANYQTHGRVIGDVRTASVSGWNLATRHTLNLWGLIHEPFAQAQNVYGIAVWQHGRILPDRFPGAILLALPGYLAGGRYSIIPASVIAALVTAGTVTALWRLLTTVVGEGPALAVALGYGLLTPTWNVSAAEMWQHTGTQAALVLALLALTRDRPGLAGLAGGAAILFRPHLGIAILILALAANWRKWLCYLAGSGLGVAILLAWNRAVYGYWTVGVEAKVHSGGVGVLGFLDGIAATLASPERGLLITCPVLIALVPHLPQAWRETWIGYKVATLAGLAYMAVQLWLIRYVGGDGFYGNRLTLESLTLAAPTLAIATVYAWQKRPRTLATLAGLSFCLTAMAASAPQDFPGINLPPWTTWDPVLVWHYSPLAAPLGLVFALAVIAGIVTLRKRVGRIFGVSCDAFPLTKPIIHRCPDGGQLSVPSSVPQGKFAASPRA